MSNTESTTDKALSPRREWFIRRTADTESFVPADHVTELLAEIDRLRANGGEKRRLLACGLCYEEQGEEVHPHPECVWGRYPEHDKQRAALREMDAIRTFVEFAQEKGIHFGRTVTTRVAVFEGTEDCTAVQPVQGEPLTKLICEHFGIDLAKIHAEKDQMVADMAALNAPKEA
jgi:hypothetical protein